MTYKSKRSQSCDISNKVKLAVWERDHHRCVLCGNPQAMPNAHFISRFDGGLGVEKNILTLCLECHRQYDQSAQRNHLQVELEAYLRGCYKDWNKQELIFNNK